MISPAYLSAMQNLVVDAMRFVHGHGHIVIALGSALALGAYVMSYPRWVARQAVKEAATDVVKRYLEVGLGGEEDRTYGVPTSWLPTLNRLKVMIFRPSIASKASRHRAANRARRNMRVIKELVQELKFERGMAQNTKADRACLEVLAKPIVEKAVKEGRIDNYSKAFVKRMVVELYFVKDEDEELLDTLDSVGSMVPA